MKRPQMRSGVTRFGDVRTPGGTAYLIRGTRTEDRVKLWAQLLLDHLRAKGVRVNFKVRLAAKKRARTMISKLDAEIAAEGIPEGIRQLLEAESKRDQERISRNLSLSGRDFQALVYNCGLLGLKHRTKNVELIPDQLGASAEEANAFFSAPKVPGVRLDGPARRYFKKITSAFEQRKHITVHLFFAKDGPWHCFYFTFRDIFPDRADGSNHWQGGPHVHYVSHHWPEWTCQTIWTALEERRTSISSLHVRFVDEDEDANDDRSELSSALDQDVEA